MTDAQVFHEAALGVCGRGIADLSGLSEGAVQILSALRTMYNESLALEEVRGTRTNRRFIFDYVDDSTVNATAFYDNGIHFIAINIGLTNAAIANAAVLGQSSAVRSAIGAEGSEPQAIGLVLFHMAIAFCVTHEYAHHHWNHVGPYCLVRRELNASSGGNLKAQAEEVIADTYSTHLVATVILRGRLREGMLEMLGLQNRPPSEQDQCLLGLLIVAIGAFVAIHCVAPFDAARVRAAEHPPAGTRLSYIMEWITIWCRSNGVSSDVAAWVNGNTYRKLMQLSVGTTNLKSLAAEMKWRQSEPGTSYLAELSDVANKLKQVEPKF